MTSLILDTNTLLRFLLADIPSQYKKARATFSEIESGRKVGDISILVINETIWALDKFYDKPIAEAVSVVQKLLSLKNIKILEIEKKELVQILNNTIKYKIDFTDAYLLWIGKKEDHKISTFDKKLQALI